MALFIDTIQALLDPLAPGGSWYGINLTEPLATDANGIAPFMTWMRIVSVDDVTFDGASDTQSTRIQVDIFAPTITQAEAIRKLVDAALDTLQTVPLSSQDIYEEPVRLWRISRDYSIWFNEG